MHAQRQRDRFDAAVARVAARRHGVFGHADVLSLGGTRSMIAERLAAGRWIKVHRGVYAIAGVEASAQWTAMAACLAAGPDAYASHATAGVLWKLERIEAGEPHIRAPRHVRIMGVTWHRGFDLRDRTRIGAIPVTTPERTIVDLAAIVTPDALAIALDDALRRRLIRFERLRARLDGVATSGRPGVRALRRLIDERTGVAASESVFETILMRTLRRAGLPVPVAQHEIRDEDFAARPDFAYPDVKLAIEADSRRFHSSPVDWERDLARRNRLTALGWRVIHVTWRQLLDDPASVTESIARALGARAR